MAQNIEFFLHPPSPKADNSSSSSISTGLEFKLPPVSSLLLDDLSLPPCSLPSLSPFMGSLSLDSPPQLSPHSSPCSSFSLLLPPPTRTRSLSNASTSSSCSIRSLMNDPLDPEEPPKRKRGRPPSVCQAPHQRDSWTFVTPTVWDVKHKEIEPPCKQDDDYMVLHWPTQQGQSTFTNSNMENTLSMPKKKRGRKPKMELAGNFCFVWRDLTARRGANKKKKALVIK